MLWARCVRDAPRSIHARAYERERFEIITFRKSDDKDLRVHGKRPCFHASLFANGVSHETLEAWPRTDSEGRGENGMPESPA